MDIRTLALAGIFAVTAAGVQASTLTTTFAGGTNWDGNMFDVAIGGNNLTLQAFDVNLQSGGANLAFYMRTGTRVGVERDAPSWSLVQSGPVVSSGAGNPSFWDIADLTLNAGQTYGFYITTTGSGPDMISTNTAGGGTVAAENDDLIIYEGISQRYPFRNFILARTWNGTIHYEVQAAAVPLPATAPLLIAGLGLLGLLRRRARG